MTEPATILRDSTLFRGVAPEAVTTLLERGRIVQLHAGEELLSPDLPNHTFYFVLEGTLHVLVGAAGSATPMPVRSGECLGEMSIIDGGRVSAPVVADGAVSVLTIDVGSFWQLTESHPLVARNLLGILADRMRSTNQALAASLQREHTYEHLALLDPLTAMHNRRWLDQMLPRYLERARRDARPFTLGIFDLDHFKRFNDTWGHPAGDAALCATAQAVQAHIRPSDRVARIGGEEFCLLLPDTDRDGARVAAARLVRRIAENPVQAGDGSALPPVTISLGFAVATADTDAAALLAAADKALYRAKHEGRNRAAG
jgi:diguanylate cyclase (GGDEF)-like protein